MPGYVCFDSHRKNVDQASLMKAHWGGGPLKVVYSGWGIGSITLSFKSDLQVGVQIPPPHPRAMVVRLDLVFGSEMTFGAGHMDDDV